MNLARKLLAKPSAPVYPEFTVAPIIDLDISNFDDYGGGYIPSRGVTISSNILAHNTGDIRSEATFSGTVTRRYTAGPSVGTAQRLQYTATNHIFYPYSGRVLPAGTWKYSIAVKSTAGAGTQNVRYGPTGSLTSTTVSEGSWSYFTRTITADGVTSYNFTIQGDGSNQPDLLIDENRMHPDDGSIDLPFATDAGSAMPIIGIPGRWSVSGGVLSGNKGGIIRGPDWPAATTMTEFTVILAFREDTLPGGTTYPISAETDTALGTTTNDMNMALITTGALQTQPRALTTSPAPNYCDGNWQAISIRVKNAKRDVTHWGVMLNATDTAFTDYEMACMRFMGLSETGFFAGEVAVCAMWDSYLTEAQLQSAFETVQARLEYEGHDTERGKTVLLMEGDSRSANTSGVAFNMYIPTNTDSIPMFGGVYATSGEGIDDVVASTIKNFDDIVLGIRTSVALGRIPVAVAWIGVNDNSTIASNPSSYLASLEDYWQSLKDEGALVVACTEIGAGAPLGGTGSGYDNGRLTLRTGILASSVPDGVADIGNPATLMGDSDSYSENPSLWTDTIHPNAAGHTEMTPIYWAAIKSAAGL